MRRVRRRTDPETRRSLERQLLDLCHGEYVDAPPGNWLTWHGRGLVRPQPLRLRPPPRRAEGRAPRAPRHPRRRAVVDGPPPLGRPPGHGPRPRAHPERALGVRALGGMSGRVTPPPRGLRADSYRRALQLTVAAAAAPYGYTLTVWTSGAVVAHERGIPDAVGAILFAAGAIIGFALVGLVAYGASAAGRRRRRRRSRCGRASTSSASARPSRSPSRWASSSTTTWPGWWPGSRRRPLPARRRRAARDRPRAARRRRGRRGGMMATVEPTEVMRRYVDAMRAGDWTPAWPSSTRTS